jgi:hypothetical protein
MIVVFVEKGLSVADSPLRAVVRLILGAQEGCLVGIVVVGSEVIASEETHLQRLDCLGGIGCCSSAGSELK